VSVGVNRGLLWNQEKANIARMAPVFDNGTSLGYEILESKMANFTNPARMLPYIDKGRHHLRWQLSDKEQCQHVDLLVQLVKRHPAIKSQIKNKIALFQIGPFKGYDDSMYKVPNQCSIVTSTC
jgi:hypothetical protein